MLLTIKLLLMLICIKMDLALKKIKGNKICNIREF